MSLETHDPLLLGRDVCLNIVRSLSAADVSATPRSLQNPKVVIALA